MCRKMLASNEETKIELRTQEKLSQSQHDYNPTEASPLRSASMLLGTQIGNSGGVGVLENDEDVLFRSSV